MTVRATCCPSNTCGCISPSAEVKGHGPGQEVLVLGKQNVGIKAVEPVGQYAVKLVFDDGHDSGLYSWKYLRELGDDHAAELGEVPAARSGCPTVSHGSRPQAGVEFGRSDIHKGRASSDDRPPKTPLE
mgnify:CR=1 FL=1